MSFDIEKFVIIDNHAHSLLKDHRELDEIGFRQCFSESRSLGILQKHIPRAIHYIDLLDQLQRIFNVRSEQEFLAFRSNQPADEYVQLLWDYVSIGALIIDDGFNSEKMVSIKDLASVSGRPIFHCKRIEPILEECVREADTLSELKQLFSKKLLQKNKRPPTALKTICGYRGGLTLLNPTEAEAKTDFDKVKKSLAKAKSFRIEKSDLYHYMLLHSFELAGQADIPVQIHSGIGDDDANLTQCNPALMQDLFRKKRFARTTFVLLHCYPYVREGAFMCSLYNNVYMDLSLSISLASSRSARLVGEGLSLAPASKILAGTDGHSCPESHWYGALAWKRGLSHCLFEMINGGLITQREAEEIGARILHQNAIELYKLEGLA